MTYRIRAYLSLSFCFSNWMYASDVVTAFSFPPLEAPSSFSTSNSTSTIFPSPPQVRLSELGSCLRHLFVQLSDCSCASTILPSTNWAGNILFVWTQAWSLGQKATKVLASVLVYGYVEYHLRAWLQEHNFWPVAFWVPNHLERWWANDRSSRRYFQCWFKCWWW